MATKEISTGPVPVGSQLVSDQPAERHAPLSTGLVRLVPGEATTSQLLDAAVGFEGQRLRPV